MPRLIAMDLGSHAVKVSTYRISGRQVDLESRHHQPVPQDGVLPGRDVKLVALSALLEDEEELAPEAGDTVVVSYPSSQATFRRMSLPFTERAQIESTLPFQLEEEVPFELSEMVLGWRTAEQGEGGTQVVAVLARHEPLAQFLAELSELEVDPAFVHVDADVYGPWGGAVAAEPIPVDVDPEDVLEAPPGSPLVAVVDVGHSHTTVTVVRNGVAQLCRSINLGGFALTRAIQQAMDCSWEEAEQLKHGSEQVPVPATADNPDVEITQPIAIAANDGSGYPALKPEAKEAVDQAIRLLLAELRTTLIKAEDELGAEMAEVRITGGSSRMAVIRDTMAEDLGVPVLMAEDPSGDGASGPFALSAALAWSAVPGVQSAVDLRVGDLQYRGGTSLVRATLTYGVAGALCFIVAATVMFGWQYWTLSSEQAAAEQAVFETVQAALGSDAGGAGLETLTAAKALMAGMTEDAAQIASVVGDGSGVPKTIDTLYHLTKAFPPHEDVKVQLSDLSITAGTISFNAETDTYNSSATVENRLKADPRFSTATKGTENRLSNGRVKFPITIDLGGNSAEAGEEG